LSEENAVYVQLTGRMGNHLFQFATAFRLALDHQSELVLFDSIGAFGSQAGLGRVLARTYRMAQPADMVKFGRLLYGIPLRQTVDGLYSKAMAPRLLRGDRRSVVREEDFGPVYHFHPEILSFAPPVLLTGFFQNEDYFAPRSTELLEVLQLPAVSDILPPDLAGPLIAVVFRRGDYVDQHWDLPLRYYEHAVDQLSSLVAGGTMLVFSDDVAFADLACDWLAPRYRALAVPTLSTDPAVHLALMQRCDHHISANSSFSWWGAWLAEHRNPGAEHHILVPDGWISGDSALIPSRWTRVAY
jgi:hypothetical protein